MDTNIYLVTSGSLRLYVIEEFEEHTIRFGYENSIIAALDSYISEKPWDLYIQALNQIAHHYKSVNSAKSTRYIFVKHGSIYN